MDGVPDVTQPPVKPGEAFTYDFVAPNAEVGMYHSHHHAEHQVPDGLLARSVGAEPLPAGVTPDPGGADGAERRRRDRPQPERQVVPRDRARDRQAGRWVEIHYFNEGMQIHPMHLHGMPQLVIAKDGFPVPVAVSVRRAPDARRGGVSGTCRPRGPGRRSRT